MVETQPIVEAWSRYRFQMGISLRVDMEFKGGLEAGIGFTGVRLGVGIDFEGGLGAGIGFEGGLGEGMGQSLCQRKMINSAFLL